MFAPRVFKSIGLTFLCLLSELLHMAYGNLAITSPVNSVWEMGTKNLITWTETGDGAPAPPTFSLDLMQGPATGLQLIQQISKEVDIKEGQHTWEIPKTLQPGNYSLRAGSPPNVVYSTYFEIKSPGSGGTSPPISAPPKAGKKPEKEAKKPQHDDQARKSSGASVEAPAAASATPPLDGSPAKPSPSNAAGTKKTQKNNGSIPGGVYSGYLMGLALSVYSYYC